MVLIWKAQETKKSSWLFFSSEMVVGMQGNGYSHSLLLERNLQWQVGNMPGIYRSWKKGKTRRSLQNCELVFSSQQTPKGEGARVPIGKQAGWRHLLPVAGLFEVQQSSEMKMTEGRPDVFQKLPKDGCNKTTRSTTACNEHKGRCRWRFKSIITAVKIFHCLKGMQLEGKMKNWPRRHELKQMMKINI